MGHLLMSDKERLRKAWMTMVFEGTAKEIILDLHQSKYMGFGPTLAAEKLAEEGHVVDHETLQRWLIEKNLWIKERKRRTHHQKRDRRMQFGELVQMDSSIHDWFSNASSGYCEMPSTYAKSVSNNE